MNIVLNTLMVTFIIFFSLCTYSRFYIVYLLCTYFIYIFLIHIYILIYVRSKFGSISNKRYISRFSSYYRQVRHRRWRKFWFELQWCGAYYRMLLIWGKALIRGNTVLLFVVLTFYQKSTENWRKLLFLESGTFSFCKCFLTKDIISNFFWQR